MITKRNILYLIGFGILLMIVIVKLGFLE